MITNAEARDTYYDAYLDAGQRYEEIKANSEKYQADISRNRGISEQAANELSNIQKSLDTYYDFLQSCQKNKENCSEETSQIAEYARQFQSSITHSVTTVDVFSYYDGYMKSISQYLDEMIKKIQDIIASLEDRQRTVSLEKENADIALSEAQTNMGALESESATLVKMEESYYWYKYYLVKCDEDGEGADSGLT